MDNIEQLREVAPYIRGLKDSTLVVLIPGEIQQLEHYPTIIKDLNLLHSVGVRLLLVFGTRPQIDQALVERGKEIRMVNLLRITSRADIDIICEQMGRMQMRHNALFSATVPIATPLPSSTPSLLWGDWISAQPIGIIDGVDFERTGTIRQIKTDTINELLEHKHVLAFHCLATTRLGYLCNINCEDISRQLAIAVQADKLIVLTDSKGIEKIMIPGNSVSYHELEQLLGNIDNQSKISLLTMAINACKEQVKRVHFIDANSTEALLEELFTRDGSSLMITDDSYQTIRRAQLDMTPVIYELIAPMVTKGLLRPRQLQLLEQQINDFFVLAIEQNIIGCAALHKLDDQSAELACFVIANQYQGKGKGYSLLKQIILEARSMGVQRLIVLTTQSKDWFESNGFEPVNTNEYDWLFATGKYDSRRNARVLIRQL